MTDNLPKELDYGPLTLPDTYKVTFPQTWTTTLGAPCRCDELENRIAELEEKLRNACECK